MVPSGYRSYVLLLAVTLPATADEAIRADGSRQTGSLLFSDSKRFTFEGPVAGIDLVRFSVKPPAGPTVSLWHQVRLGRDEVLFAEVRKLDDTHLHVRAAWADALPIPRAFVERVTHVPGGRPILFDAFEADLANWKKTGEPRTADGKLILNRDGQSAEATLPKAVDAGRVIVSFRSARTTTRRLVLELGHTDNEKGVRIDLVGPGERYLVTSPTKPNNEPAVLRDSAMHRLQVEFSRDKLHLFVDDLVLWTQSKGPGELKSIKLIAEGGGEESAVVDDMLVVRSEAIAELRAWADLTADAIRTSNGDETFGILTKCDPSGVTLDAKERKVSASWMDVAEIAFRRVAAHERATTGEHVRVRIVSAEGRRDVLEGAIKAFDAKELVLSHRALGDLAIPRNRIEEIRFLFHGRQLPVDSTPRHLGAKPAFGFAVSKPEGLSLKKMLKLDEDAIAGFVVVDAARLSSYGTPLEVLVNGVLQGELNRQTDRSDANVRSYRLPLPAKREREIEVELRMSPSKDGSRVTGVDVRAVRLELYDPR